MNFDEDYKNMLIEKYRKEQYERVGASVEKMNDYDLIPDNELKAIISLNNNELIRLENETPQDIEKMRKLFIANVNFYRLAKARQLSVHGFSIIAPIANIVGYDTKRLFAELSVGGYNSLFEKSGPTMSELLDREFESRGMKR